MNNFLVLCRMFSGVLASCERLVFRRDATSDFILLNAYADRWVPGFCNSFSEDVLSEHLNFLFFHKAISNPICLRHRISPEILFRVLCVPANYNSKIYVLIGRGIRRSNNHEDYRRPIHPAMSCWWNNMNNTRLELPLADISRDQMDRALISYYLSAPAGFCPSHFDCAELVMLLVHTSPTLIMGIYYRLLVTPRREDYTGAAVLHADIVQVSMFMAYIESIHEYHFHVPHDSIPFPPAISLRPPVSDRVLRSQS